MTEHPQDEEVTKFKNLNAIEEAGILGQAKGGKPLSEMDESRDDWMDDKKIKGGKPQGMENPDDTNSRRMKGDNPNKAPKTPPNTS